MEHFFQQALIYLAAGAIAAPLAQWLGLGSVLGYLAAGLIIGPFAGLAGLDLIGSDTEELRHFAESGVVMMLFLVGLELEPAKLWRMRRRLIGMGGAQTLITMGLIACAGLALGLSGGQALAVGMIFALSSTAIVLQTLSEKGLMKAEAGRSCFSVLLFQDIAVIPMLAILPLLAVSGAHEAASGHGGLHDLPAWLRPVAILGAVAAVVLGGRYVVNPIFRAIARLNMREAFTAAALALVVFVIVLMTAVGLSPALGAFLAGVVLADSEFRHELESAIDPFKALLMGLFFITVGASVDVVFLAANAMEAVGIAAGVMALKLGVLLLVARMFALKLGDKWLFALALAQAGEFGFVLLNFTGKLHLLGPDLNNLLSVSVALTMLATPALFILYDRFFASLQSADETREDDEMDGQGEVVIAGLGRFGQIVNRMLISRGVETVVLDQSATQVENMRRFDVKSYYGDASRPELLEAARIKEARLFVVALDDMDRCVAAVEYVKRHYEHVRVVARAYDRHHAYRLRRAGADEVIRETFHSALEAGNRALRALGAHPYAAEKITRAFELHDQRAVERLYGYWDGEPNFFNDKAYITAAKEQAALLQQAMRSDRLAFRDRERGDWAPLVRLEDEDFEEEEGGPAPKTPLAAAE